MIVPVRDDAGGVERTVADLDRQTLEPTDYEVIVVDNGSTDATLATAQRLAASHRADVRVLVEATVVSSYAARNTGIRAARGGLLCFVDAGVGLPAGYLATVRAAFENGRLDYAGCPIRVEVNRPTVAAAYNAIFGFPVAHYLDDRGWVPTACLSVRRSVVESVGPFDDRLASGGDVEFGQRVADAGYTQRLITDTEVRHPARATVGALVRKTRRTARGKVRLAHLDARHAATVRAYASPERLRPVGPSWIRGQLAARSVPVTWRSAVGVAALKTLLDLVRLVTAAVEWVRLRTARGQRTRITIGSRTRHRR